MEEFRIHRSSKAPAGALVFLLMVCLLSLGALPFMGIYGLIIIAGVILIGGTYLLILKTTLEKKELVIDDDGLRFYRKEELIQKVNWKDVKRIESFDRSKNDFLFHVFVKDGLHFIPDPYFFQGEDMRKAYEKVKEATNGMNIEFIDHDHRLLKI